MDQLEYFVKVMDLVEESLRNPKTPSPPINTDESDERALATPEQ